MLQCLTFPLRPTRSHSISLDFDEGPFNLPLRRKVNRTKTAAGDEPGRAQVESRLCRQSVHSLTTLSLPSILSGKFARKWERENSKRLISRASPWGALKLNDDTTKGKGKS